MVKRGGASLLLAIKNFCHVLTYLEHNLHFYWLPIKKSNSWSHLCMHDLCFAKVIIYSHIFIRVTTITNVMIETKSGSTWLKTMYRKCGSLCILYYEKQHLSSLHVWHRRNVLSMIIINGCIISIANKSTSLSD